MKNLRMCLDAVMVVLLPLLMGYSLIGELYHEVIGVSMAFFYCTYYFKQTLVYVAF